FGGKARRRREGDSPTMTGFQLLAAPESRQNRSSKVLARFGLVQQPGLCTAPQSRGGVRKGWPIVPFNFRGERREICFNQTSLQHDVQDRENEAAVCTVTKHRKVLD